jgi:hypothetical protein
MEIITKITPYYAKPFELEEELPLKKAIKLTRSKGFMGRLQIEYIMTNGNEKIVCADFGVDENNRLSYHLLPNKI